MLKSLYVSMIYTIAFRIFLASFPTISTSDLFFLLKFPVCFELKWFCLVYLLKTFLAPVILTFFKRDFLLFILGIIHVSILAYELRQLADWQ